MTIEGHCNSRETWKYQWTTKHPFPLDRRTGCLPKFVMYTVTIGLSCLPSTKLTFRFNLVVKNIAPFRSSSFFFTSFSFLFFLILFLFLYFCFIFYSLFYFFTVDLVTVIIWGCNFCCYNIYQLFYLTKSHIYNVFGDRFHKEDKPSVENTHVMRGTQTWKLEVQNNLSMVHRKIEFHLWS